MMAKRYHSREHIWRETVELFSCPDCGFSFDACHSQDDREGGWICPVCEAAELEAAFKSYCAGLRKEAE
jgi:predicted RNA-binding Zn-ribbon protein involved in translation (DUF1610 family)